jgi:hypothetical protein
VRFGLLGVELRIARLLLGCMDGTTCYPLIASTDQHGSLVPVTSVAAADQQDDSNDNSDSAGFLWQCWCFILDLLAIIHGLRLQVIDLRAQAHYWQAQHERAVIREAVLKEEKQYLQAQIRDLQQRLFGRKSETSSSADAKVQGGVPPDQPPVQRRRRGQQRGAKSHGRRNHDHLPPEDENCTLPEDQRCCPWCQEPFEEIPGTADGSILEVDVRAHRRCYHRQRYRRH